MNKKVLARDRIRRIMDKDAEFFEICPTAGLGLEYGNVPGGGTVCGIGVIRGNLVMILANDGSLKGGGTILRLPESGARYLATLWSAKVV